MIYKILREDEYMDFVVDGQTNGTALDIKDKYIHFSTKEQLKSTLEKHFYPDEVLHLVGIDETKMDNIKWEKARGDQLFPHLYGILHMSDVIETWDIDDEHHVPRNLP